MIQFGEVYGRLVIERKGVFKVALYHAMLNATLRWDRKDWIPGIKLSVPGLSIFGVKTKSITIRKYWELAREVLRGWAETRAEDEARHALLWHHDMPRPRGGYLTV
jgi:hypothetical protein